MKMKYKRGTTLYDYCIKEDKLWILEQFDKKKNVPITPKDITKSSSQKLWFSYNCGHSCLQRVSDKTSKDSKQCPYCLNRGKVGKSLAEIYPQFAKLFYVKYNKTTPDKIPKQSGNKYFWKCSMCGDIFEETVARVVKGYCTCSNCKKTTTSFPEYCVCYYLQKIDSDIKQQINIENYKFDIFSPKYNLVIEYDGYPWHNSSISKLNDALKDQIALKYNHRILRIRDSRLKNNTDLSAIIWSFKYDDNLSFLNNLPEVLKREFNINCKDIKINIKKDFDMIKLKQYNSFTNNSIDKIVPEIYDYIDDEIDINSEPKYVHTASHKIRFWFKHPQYEKLKWSKTAHDIYQSQTVFTQRVKMCIKMLSKYPELETQICTYGNNIHESSIFILTCKCGNRFNKSYSALISKNKVTLCPSCLKQTRIDNLKKYRDLHKISIT